MDGYNAEERHLHEMLRMLQESYAKAAKPYIDRLAAIQSARPPPPMLVTREQAEAMGLVVPNVQIEGRAAFGASLSNAVLGVMWIARLPASASWQRTVRIWLRRIQATVFGRLPYATVHSRQ